MAKKKVFVSFDYDNDKHYKNLLAAWSANPDFEFEFHDHTPTEIQTNDISRVKAGLTTKINQATHTIVLVGKEINKLHKDRVAIGYDNWQHFEIAKSKESNNKIVYVKLLTTNNLPTNYAGGTYKTVNGFTEAGILSALKEL